MTENTSSSSSARGPVDHSVRDQIVAAATEHFAHYGYEKTTVSDLAKTIGFSKAYIYKFFDSKQAIGEVICSNCLRSIESSVAAAMAGAPSATESLRRLFKAIINAGVALFFHERKLYDVAAFSSSEHWQSSRDYESRVRKIIEDIIRDGRAKGEFERKTPLDETVNAIYLVLDPYVNPLLLQYNLDRVEEAAQQISALVLRSLAP